MSILKKLTKHGNSQALVIDRPVLDLLNITEDTILQISTDGTNLIISPIQDGDSNRKSFEKALNNANKRYPNALKKLAES
ncbi:MAG: AbrB/MazE/SpoVT family DNA-binding domain-containing protein [Candidatus Obscuribacterales bacterium]|nr:AbrB/MazE/SpoVT family DNA-binding domain-containing protein [Candidatus Obscuribacterales bacterium]